MNQSLFFPHHSMNQKGNCNLNTYYFICVNAFLFILMCSYREWQKTNIKVLTDVHWITRPVQKVVFAPKKIFIAIEWFFWNIKFVFQFLRSSWNDVFVYLSIYTILEQKCLALNPKITKNAWRILTFIVGSIQTLMNLYVST